MNASNKDNDLDLLKTVAARYKMCNEMIHSKIELMEKHKQSVELLDYMINSNRSDGVGKENKIKRLEIKIKDISTGLNSAEDMKYV